MNRLLGLAALSVATGAFATAQSPLYSFTGANAGEQLGHTVSDIGDLDGDGHGDFAIAAPYADVDGWVDAGELRFYSGRTGLRLRRYRGDRDYQELGFAVAGLGDLDGDGHGDVAIGMNVGRFRYPGEVWVTTGRTGRILYRLSGEASYDFFGSALAGIGDVDGDGYADLAIGAPGRDDNGNNSGRVQIWSGMSRTVIHTFYGSAANEDFGFAVGAPGDVDGDGIGDLLVGAPRYDLPGKPDCGAAVLYSGKSGARLWSGYGDAAGDGFGCSVSGAGDVNGDGTPDLIVGAHRHAASAGLARVFSGRDGAVLHSWVGATAGDEFGYAVRGAGDVDGDGRGDLLVGAPSFDGPAGADSGRTHLYSGATGNLLNGFDGGSAGARNGASVASAGDVDADGFFDVIVGAPGAQGVGVAEVFSLGGVGSPSRVVYREAGCRSSDGRQPRIEIVGLPVLGGSYEGLLYGVHPNATALLNFGIQWDLPLGSLAPGCVLYAYPLDIRTAVTNGDGVARAVPFTSIPVNPSFVGVEIHHQWLVIDPANNPLGVAASNDAVVFLGR